MDYRMKNIWSYIVWHTLGIALSSRYISSVSFYTMSNRTNQLNHNSFILYIPADLRTRKHRPLFFTHWGRDKIAANFRKFPNAFSCMEIVLFFTNSVFPLAQLTISQHWGSRLPTYGCSIRPRWVDSNFFRILNSRYSGYNRPGCSIRTNVSRELSGNAIRMKGMDRYSKYIKCCHQRPAPTSAQSFGDKPILNTFVCKSGRHEFNWRWSNWNWAQLCAVYMVRQLRLNTC